MKLFALATTLHRHEGGNEIIKPVVGYRVAPTLDAAVGNFVKTVKEGFPNTTLGEVIPVEIPMKKVVDLIRKTGQYKDT